MRILYLAWAFPPITLTGQVRPAAIVRRLAGEGITPVVLTASVESMARRHPEYAIDPHLLEGLTGQVEMHHVEVPLPRPRGSRGGEFLRGLYQRGTDDFHDLAGAQTIAKCAEIVAQVRPQAIVATLPPFSTGRTAAAIAERFRLPLILDMRDGWVFWGVWPYPSYLAFWRDRADLRRTFSKASAIIGVTDLLIEALAAQCPRVDRSRFHVVSNGFEPKPQAALAKEPDAPFVVGFSANVLFDPRMRSFMRRSWWRRPWHKKLQYWPHRDDHLYRTPHFFLRALARAFEKRPEIRARTTFRLIGLAHPWLREMIKEHGLEDRCEMLGFLKPSETKTALAGCDAFLAVTMKAPDVADYALPLKLFEYVQFERPILGFVVPGVAKTFLERCGVGVLCDPDDSERSSDTLIEVLTRRTAVRRDDEYLSNFHWSKVVSRFAAIVRAVAKPDPR